MKKAIIILAVASLQSCTLEFYANRFMENATRKEIPATLQYMESDSILIIKQNFE